MDDSRGEPTNRNMVKLAGVAWLHPAFAIIVGGRRLLRHGGWRKALLFASVMGNVLFLTGIILAELDLEDDNDKHDASVPPDCRMPDGLTCRSQGPLFFGELAPGSDAATILAPTVFVVQNGCLLAAFEYDDDRAILQKVQLYDRKCRPRIELDLSTGATNASFYGDASDPEYSLRDTDGDGIPDVRVNWDDARGLRRSAEVLWVPHKTP